MTTIQHQKAFHLLPYSQKQEVSQATRTFKTQLQKSYHIQDGQQVQANGFPLLLVIGIIVCLGGVFLSIAAHQILPFNINCIHSLGFTGQMLGYAAAALGLLISIIASVKTHQVHHQNQNVQSYSTKGRILIAAHAHHLQTVKMQTYFLERIKRGEMCVVDDVNNHKLMLYYKQEADNPQSAEIVYASSAEEALIDWLEKHPDISQLHHISFAELQHRIDKYEGKKKLAT